MATPERPALPEDARILLRRARAGSGTLLVLTGADRWSRESALQGVAEEAERRGWSVLRARGFPAQRDVPFGALQDLLERLRPQLPPSRVPAPLASLFSVAPPERRSRRARAEGGVEVPEGEAVLPVPYGLAPREEGFPGEQVRDELLHLLLPTVPGAPRLLAVSDVEYLDEASRSFFSELATKLERAPMGVALSLADEPRAREEWARALTSRPAVWTRVGMSAPAARRATEEVLRKLRSLSPDELRATTAAVIAGPDATLPVLSVTLGVRASELEGLLARAAEAGALWKEGSRYHPTEAAVSEAVLAQVGTGELARLHGTLARGLRKVHPVPHGNVLFRIAEHWARSGNAAEAVPALLAAAGESRRRGASASGVEMLRRAVLLAQRDPSPALRLWEERSHAALGALLASSGEVPPAMDEYGRALRLARARSASVAAWGPHEERVLWLLESAGAFDGLRERLEALASEAQRGKLPALEAEAVSTLVHFLAIQGDTEAAIALAPRAVTKAEASRDPGLVVRALRMAGRAQLSSSPPQPRACRAPLERALEVARDAKDRAGEALTLDLLSRTAAALGERSEAVRLGEEARDMARRSGARLVLAEVLVHLTEAAVQSGELERAEEVLRELRPEMEKLQLGASHPLAAAALLAEARQRLARGELPSARRALSDLVAGYDLRGNRFLWSRVLLALAQAQMRTGDRADARRTLARIEKERLAGVLPPLLQEEHRELQRELGPGP